MKEGFNIGDKIKIVKVDRFGLQGREHHPGPSDIGKTGTIRSVINDTELAEEGIYVYEVKLDNGKTVDIADFEMKKESFKEFHRGQTVTTKDGKTGKIVDSDPREGYKIAFDGKSSPTDWYKPSELKSESLSERGRTKYKSPKTGKLYSEDEVKMIHRYTGEYDVKFPDDNKTYPAIDVLIESFKEALKKPDKSDWSIKTFNKTDSKTGSDGWGYKIYRAGKVVFDDEPVFDTEARATSVAKSAIKDFYELAMMRYNDRNTERKSVVVEENQMDRTATFEDENTPLAPVQEEPKVMKYKLQAPYFNGTKWVDLEEAEDEDSATKLYYKYKSQGKAPRVVDIATNECVMEHLMKESLPTKKCPECKGTGKVSYNNYCPTCDGTGQVEIEEKESVSIKYEPAEQQF